MTQDPAAELDTVAHCACGKVTVTVKGRPLSMLLCACVDCQKATGTGHAAVLLMRAADVAISGETRGHARPADSGAMTTRHFCPECGTPLFGRSSRAEGVLLLPAGLFGAAAAGLRPSQLIFARSHRDWDVVDTALPRWQTYRDKEAPDE